MRILYDPQIFASQKFGGISRYFYELMKHSEGLFEYSVTGIFSENEYVKSLRLYREFPIECNFKGKRRIINFLNKLNSIRKVKQRNYDIIHPTYYDPYLLKYIKNVPLVIEEHDIKAKLQKAKENLFQKKKKNLYPKTEKKCVTSQDGILPTYKRNVKKEDYILFTGQRSGYKNFERFIEAIAPILNRYNLRLICTGSAFTEEETTLLNQHKIIEKTKAVFVPENGLQNIYSKALMFVFPSLYEGFGIPILEAFASGCPALLSRTSCFPEIAEDAAMYFDPYSVNDMRQTMEKVLLDSSIQKTLSEDGFERLKHFSWEKTAIQTHQLYYEMYSVSANKKQLVITVHDMIHELFSEYFHLDDRTILNKYIMMQNADKIIAISNNTKMDILKLYPEIDAEKIEVIYHGTSY
jgi:glycosyltransferase involved in cell wall biosynthesis